MILFPVLFLALVLVRPKRFQTNGSWWQLQPLPSPWMTRIWRPLVRSFQCRQFGGLGKSKTKFSLWIWQAESVLPHPSRIQQALVDLPATRKEGMYLAISSDFHVNLQLIVKIILKRSTDSTYLCSMRRYQVSVLDKLSLTWDSSSWFHLKRATQLELSIQGFCVRWLTMSLWKWQWQRIGTAREPWGSVSDGRRNWNLFACSQATLWTHSYPGDSVHDAVAVARHCRHLPSLTSDCTSTYLIEFHFAYLEVLPTSISTHRRVTLTLYRPW